MSNLGDIALILLESIDIEADLIVCALFFEGTMDILSVVFLEYILDVEDMIFSVGQLYFQYIVLMPQVHISVGIH